MKMLPAGDIGGMKSRRVFLADGSQRVIPIFSLPT
jgi:hypothetical protein